MVQAINNHEDKQTEKWSIIGSRRHNLSFYSSRNLHFWLQDRLLVWSPLTPTLISQISDLELPSKASWVSYLASCSRTDWKLLSSTSAHIGTRVCCNVLQCWTISFTSGSRAPQKSQTGSSKEIAKTVHSNLTNTNPIIFVNAKNGSESWQEHRNAGKPKCLNDQTLRNWDPI